jgi:hypothetical protein
LVIFFLFLLPSFSSFLSFCFVHFLLCSSKVRCSDN